VPLTAHKTLSEAVEVITEKVVSWLHDFNPTTPTPFGLYEMMQFSGKSNHPCSMASGIGTDFAQVIFRAKNIYMNYKLVYG
jgi:hypothetical protein